MKKYKDNDKLLLHPFNVSLSHCRENIPTEDGSKTPEPKRLKYLNTRISRKDSEYFLKKLKLEKAIKLTWKMPPRNPWKFCEWQIRMGGWTKLIWGRTFFDRSEIVIVRKSIGIFLHELAHILAKDFHHDEEHGYGFLYELDWLYNQWEKIMKRGK